MIFFTTGVIVYIYGPSASTTAAGHTQLKLIKGLVSHSQTELSLDMGSFAKAAHGKDLLLQFCVLCLGKLVSHMNLACLSPWINPAPCHMVAWLGYRR